MTKSILIATAMLALGACTSQRVPTYAQNNPVDIGNYLQHDLTAAQFGPALCNLNATHYAASNISCRSTSDSLLLYYPYDHSRVWLDAHCQEVIEYAQMAKIEHYKVDLTSQVATTTCRY